MIQTIDFTGYFLQLNLDLDHIQHGSWTEKQTDVAEPLTYQRRFPKG